jgi:hypothetical protein
MVNMSGYEGLEGRAVPISLVALNAPAAADGSASLPAAAETSARLPA